MKRETQATRASASVIVIARGSAPGRGTRALLRASGPSLARAFRHAFARALPAQRCHTANRLETKDGAVPCLVLWMPAPASFTGEDCFEALLPANPALIDAALDALLASATKEDCVARYAVAGEFAMRAFLNGRLALAAAEALSAAIAAQDDAELAASRLLASGALALEATAVVDETTNLLALVEAGIDFSDVEDVTAIAPSALAPLLRALSGRLSDLTASAATEDRSRAMTQVTLFGPPNAGKSSLFNALLGRERTVTADEVGTTRDAITERVEFAKDVVAELTDVAGYTSNDSPSDRIAGSARSRALDALERADLVLMCQPVDDSSVGELPAEVDPSRRLLLATKCDRPVTRPLRPDELPTSAQSGTGVDALKALIAKRLRRLPSRGAALSSVLPRQAQAVAEARGILIEAALAAEAEASPLRWSRPEEVASLLRSAIEALQPIAGGLDSDEVLGRIFSRFCIGK